MRSQRITARILLWGLLALGSGGCTLMLTGSRSVLVILVRNEVTTPDSPRLPQPTRDELKSMLAKHLLWLADDKKAARWIAYVDVRTPSTPLEPFGLTLAKLKKNPDWSPHSPSVSSPISGSNDNQNSFGSSLERSMDRVR